MSPGLLLGGRYRLVRPVGQGGMGEVWEALDERSGRRVALKTILDDAFDAEAVLRLRREALILGSLVHPGVVGATDFQSNPGEPPFLVMDLVIGEALVVRMRRGPIAPRAAIEIAIQIAEAVGAGHGRGVVHRDLKPGNVILASDSSTETVKVIDFGIARAIAESVRLTATGTLLGTPAYMAPEQLVGHDATPASDVFSMGVILLEMVTGARAFKGGVAGVLAGQKAPRARLEGTALDVPIGLDAVLDSCLATDPGARPANGDALALALRALTPTQVVKLVGKPVVKPARAPTSERRATRSSGRVFVVTIAATLVVGGVVAAASRKLVAGDPVVAPSAWLTPTPSSVDPIASAPVVEVSASPPLARSSTPARSDLRPCHCRRAFHSAGKVGYNEYICPRKQRPSCVCANANDGELCSAPPADAGTTWCSTWMPGTAEGEPCTAYRSDGTAATGTFGHCTYCPSPPSTLARPDSPCTGFNHFGEPDQGVWIED